MDELRGALVDLPQPRPLSAGERALLERLVELSSVAAGLGRQAHHVEVWQRCNCGCASVGLRATSRGVRLDERGVRGVTAHGDASDHRDVQITLHVVDGEMTELEIWTGEFGEAADPDPGTLRFADEQLRLDDG